MRDGLASQPTMEISMFGDAVVILLAVPAACAVGGLVVLASTVPSEPAGDAKPEEEVEA